MNVSCAAYVWLEPRDMRVPTCPDHPSPHVQFVSLHPTVLPLLDKSISAEYQEAWEFAPHLVSRETPVHQYLRVEDWNPLRAAKRLALRWKCRKELFGKDDWANMIGPKSAKYLKLAKA